MAILCAPYKNIEINEALSILDVSEKRCPSTPETFKIGGTELVKVDPFNLICMPPVQQ